MQLGLGVGLGVWPAIPAGAAMPVALVWMPLETHA